MLQADGGGCRGGLEAVAFEQAAGGGVLSRPLVDPREGGFLDFLWERPERVEILLAPGEHKHVFHLGSSQQ